MVARLDSDLRTRLHEACCEACRDGGDCAGGDDINRSGKAIIRDGDRFLVLKDAGTPWWDLPGGHFRQGEAPEDGLAREIGEECGLVVANAEPLMTERLQLGDELRPVDFYRASCEPGEIELSDEHTEHRWVTADEMRKLDMGAFAPLLDRLTEGQGEPCKPGERSDLTDCTPRQVQAAKGRVQIGPDEVTADPANAVPRRGQRVIRGVVVPATRARRGSSTTPEQRKTASAAREAFIAVRLERARTAILSGDLEEGESAMIDARVAAEIANSDFWVRVLEHGGGEVDPDEIGKLAGDQDAYLEALSTKFEGTDWVDTRFPKPPAPPFADVDPTERSPFTGQRYVDFRAPGQPSVQEIMGELHAVRRGRDPESRGEGGQVSVGQARAIAGDFKRAAWHAEIEGQHVAFLERFARRFLDWEPAADEQDDEEPEDVREPWDLAESALREGRGEPCKQGETAARSGCTPASGEGAPATTGQAPTTEGHAATERAEPLTPEQEAEAAADASALRQLQGDMAQFRQARAKAFADATKDLAASTEGHAATERAKELATELEDDPKTSRSQVKAFLASLGDVARNPATAASRAIKYVAGLTADAWSTLDDAAKFVAKGALRTVLGMALGSGLSAVAVLGAAAVAGTVGVVPGAIAWWAMDKAIQTTAKVVAKKVTGAEKAMETARREVGRQWKRSRRNRAKREERAAARAARLGESAPMDPSVWANMAARHVTSTRSEGWGDLRESARLERWAGGLLDVLDRTPCADVLEAARCLDAMGHTLGAIALREGEGEPCKRGERSDLTGCIKSQDKPGSGGQVQGPPTARQAGARKAAETRQVKRWEAEWAKAAAAERSQIAAAVPEPERQAQVEGLAKLSAATSALEAGIASGEVTGEQALEMAKSDPTTKSVAEEAAKHGELSADEMATLGQVMEAHAELLKPAEPATMAKQVGLAVTAVGRIVGKGALAGLKGGAMIGKLAFEASKIVARIGVRGLKVIAAGAPDLAAGLLKLAAWPIINNPVTGIILGPAALGIATAMAVSSLEAAGTLAALPAALGAAAGLAPVALPLAMIAAGQAWATRERAGGHNDAEGRRGGSFVRSFIENTAVSRTGREQVVAGVKKAWAAAWGSTYEAPPTNWEPARAGFLDLMMLGGQSTASMSARDKVLAGMDPGQTRDSMASIRRDWAAERRKAAARPTAPTTAAARGGELATIADADLADDLEIADLVDDAPFAEQERVEQIDLVDDEPFASGAGMDMRWDSATERWEPDGPATGMSEEGRLLPGPAGSRRGGFDANRDRAKAAAAKGAAARAAKEQARIAALPPEQAERARAKAAAAKVRMDRFRGKGQ